jgi:arylsulfatase A-like enzyme
LTRRAAVIAWRPFLGERPSIEYVSPVRRIAVLLGRWAVHPATLGALYMLGLVALAAHHGAEADQALGGQSRAINGAVHTYFGDEVRRITLAILGVTVAIGSLLGGLAGLVVDLRNNLRGFPPPSALVRGAASLLVVVLLHGFIEAYAIAATPQLFASAFYAEGGALRTLQVVLTDVLGPHGVLLLGFLTLVATVLGPPGEWRAWSSRLERFRRGLMTARAAKVSATLLLLALVGFLGSSLHVSSAAADPAPARPNVLILAADSLRADRIDPRIAPNLSRLATEGTRFDRAYVSLPRTFPSWVTLLTGRYPHHHGIRSMFPRWEDRAKDFDALPERLSQGGYFTAVVSDFAGDIFDRIGLGWTETHVPTFDFKQLIRQRALERQTPLLPYLQSRLGRVLFPVLRELNDAADPRLLTRDALATIASAKGRPFFVTVFFSTAHFPYAAPAPYYGEFTRDAYRGRYKYDKPVGLEHDAAPDAADIEQVRGLYDGAVAGIDDGVGEILAALERSGQAKNTIVVVIADHGETLDENGHGEGHGDHLFGDEGTHVPFIMFDPRHPAHRRVEGVVRDVDLAPTLYDLTGVAPPGDLDGASVAPVLEGADLAPRLAFAETGLWFTEEVSGVAPSLRLPYPGIAGTTEVDTDHGDEVVLSRQFRPLALVAKHRMVRDDRYKLVYVPTRSGVRYFLYDTVADPGETEDVGADHPTERSRLQGELWRWMLADSDMIERGGFLVPRDGGAVATGVADHVLRVDTTAPQAEP